MCYNYSKEAKKIKLFVVAFGNGDYYEMVRGDGA